MDVVVWNLDARYRPELEVEIEIVPELSPLEERARAMAKQIDDLFADAWFLAEHDDYRSRSPNTALRRS